ncbi:MAG: SDR family NAD(P)-dependent oxidoreductase [Cyanobacteria bacterium P01_F01_bin.13]
MGSNNKIAVLTGSTGAIGTELAKLLARDGWNLALINRSQEKSDAQLAQLRGLFTEQRFDGWIADLMDTVQIKDVISKIVSAYPQINALYNVSGLLTDQRIMSPQGVEGHFALNTLAPYMLIQGLRSSLGKALPSQLAAGASDGDRAVIANFSSSAINAVKEIDVAQLRNPDKIGGLMDAYAKSKLAVTAVTCLLKDDLLEENILIYSVDPGATKSSMTKESTGMPPFLRWLAPLLFKSPDHQAMKITKGMEVAITDGESGLFITNGRRKPNPPLALDKAFQSDLKALLQDLSIL